MVLTTLESLIIKRLSVYKLTPKREVLLIPNLVWSISGIKKEHLEEVLLKIDLDFLKLKF